MKVIPAIDLKDNQCVRLTKGKMNDNKVYFKDPLKALKMFEKDFSNIHIIDLNGAFDGKLTNYKTLKRLVENTDLKIQYGGGIRSFEIVEKLINLGIDQVIIGTMAIKNKKEFKKVVNKYNEKVIVSLDVKNEEVVINGWANNTKISIDQAIKNMGKLNVNNFLITDVSKDGTLTGPNVALYKRLLDTYNVNIIASGGVSSNKDLEKLKNIGIKKVVVGKALYENKIERTNYDN